MKFEEFRDEHLPEEWSLDWAESDQLSRSTGYVYGTGGKRLRPLLVLKTAECLGADPERAEPFARAVEHLHNYSLVHDDMQDGDEQRRNKQTVWKKFDRPRAIETGDALHASAYGTLLNQKETMQSGKLLGLLELLNKADKSISDGQSLEMELKDRSEATEEFYRGMVSKKTATLIQVSVLGGAEIAGAGEEVKDSLGNAAEKIGISFQIIDDVIDLRGGKGREQAEDVREGKRSLVAIKALNALPAEESEELLGILDNPRSETSEQQKRRVLELFRQTGAIDAAESEARNLADESLDELRECGRSEDLSDLLELFEFLVDRKF